MTIVLPFTFFTTPSSSNPLPASQLDANFSLLGKALPYANAVASFNAIGDDVVNNAAAFAAAVAFCNASGGFVIWPAGIFRTSVPIPALTSGGFIGTGSGMSHTGPGGPTATGGTYGTVFRLNAAAGDTLTIATAGNGVVVRDIGFWPVPFKTGGAEVVDHGLDSKISNLMFVYGYRGLDCSNGSNGSTAIGLRSYGMFGPDDIRVKGSSSAIADWAQGIDIIDFQSYSPWPVAEPTVALVPDKGSGVGVWVASTAYTSGQIVSANGYIWQVVVGGTSANAGGGPVIPSYNYAGEPTTRGITDNTVTWYMTEASSSAGINVDSNAVDVTVTNSRMLTKFWGLLIQNTAASSVPPQYVQVARSLMDHNIGDGVFASAGYQISLNKCKMHLSATGRGFTGGTGFTSGLEITGGHVWANALDGILLPQIAASDAVISGVDIIGNGVRTANTYDGIVSVNNGGGYALLGNLIGSDAGGTTRYGINIGATNVNGQVKDNKVNGLGTAGILNATAVSTTFQVRDNPGYVTENNGTSAVASGTTSIAVTHGLSVTPAAKDISLNFTAQGTNNYGRVWLSSFTSTQFTVNVTSDPGSSLTFEWQAIVV